MALNREKRTCRVAAFGGVVNAALMLFKFAAGIFGRSAAMTADAVHSLSDLVSDLVVLIFARLANRPEDEDHSYGHGKYETLAALVIGIMLAAAGIGILWGGCDSILSFYAGEAIGEPNMLALAAAIISVAVKEGLYQYTIRVSRKIGSAVLAVSAWHHRSDAITSVAALFGIAGAMCFGPKWIILDPLSAVFVSFFVIKISWDMIRPCLDELLEKSLPEEEKIRIAEILETTPGVIAFHRLRTRRIGASRAIDAHLKLKGDLPLKDAHEIASNAEKRLREQFGGKTLISIHMEPEK